jgi:putative acetyltransferase
MRADIEGSSRLRITRCDFNDPRAIELLHFHQTSAHAETAPGSAHALDLKGLQSPDITVWTICDNECLVGVGALKVLRWTGFLLPCDHGLL